MGYVVLTHADQHLGLVPDAASGRSRLRPTAGPPTAAAVFRRIELSHNRIALQTLDGRYLTVHEDESLSFGVYADDDFGPSTTFEEVLWPGGEVSLKTHRLTFVSVTDSGRVTANRTLTETSERFVMTSAPRALRPVVAQPEPDIPRVVSLPRQPGPGGRIPAQEPSDDSSVGRWPD